MEQSLNLLYDGDKVVKFIVGQGMDEFRPVAN
jgi:hypothetical protein